MNVDSVPIPQQSPVERQHQVIKTKTIGNAGSDTQGDNFKVKLEAQTRNNEKNTSGEKADKVKNEMLDRAGEMRHLKYEVIDEAAIVQVSVINTEDGTIVRKVPPDKVVELVERMSKNKKRSSSNDRFDVKL